MNTNTNISFDKSNWSHLLHEAITKPGMLLEAYRAFWNYSIGNQILAIWQCRMRGIEVGAMATFQGWKEKGRNVKKGEKAVTLCMPITVKDKSSDDDSYFTAFVYKPRWFVYSQTEGAEFYFDCIKTPNPCFPFDSSKFRRLSCLTVFDYRVSRQIETRQAHESLWTQTGLNRTNVELKLQSLPVRVPL